jgi:hypothetical protein
MCLYAILTHTHFRQIQNILEIQPLFVSLKNCLNPLLRYIGFELEDKCLKYYGNIVIFLAVSPDFLLKIHLTHIQLSLYRTTYPKTEKYKGVRLERGMLRIDII